MKTLRIALAGNANVGKSVIFNHLTGLSQHIGNWPGKTVEKAEGSLIYQNYKINIVDLPGIYSLTPNSPEEMVARKYIRTKEPDVVVNILDASALERNLYLTFQLLELGVPLILVLNMTDVAGRKGIMVDRKRLERELKVPIIETVAIHGKGVDEIIKKAIAVKEGRIRIRKMDKSRDAAERYKKIGRLARKVEKSSRKKVVPLDERIDAVVLHRFFGYAILAIILLLVFFSIFTFGEWLSGLFYSFFNVLKDAVETRLGSAATKNILWEGVVNGIFASLAVAIPFILPFYIIFAFLEDSGYLVRIAFLMDGFMHTIGLHGKAFIPLFLGYGCNVPACIGCRIIETDKQRLLTAFLSTMIPCAARSVIILGLVGTYLGWQWALAVYIFNILMVVAIGRLFSKALIGEPISLIMEMPSYKIPHLPSILKKASERVKHYARVAFPIIIVMSILISLMETIGLVKSVEVLLSPVTVGWLGLPAAISITLIFGILRKELALIMLASIFGTTNFDTILSPVQMIVFTLVMLFYIPCSATIATLMKEFGWKRAAAMTVFEIVFAIALGGIAARLLPIVL